MPKIQKSVKVAAEKIIFMLNDNKEPGRIVMQA